jgi:hypothetical protein
MQLNTLLVTSLFFVSAGVLGMGSWGESYLGGNKPDPPLLSEDVHLSAAQGSQPLNQRNERSSSSASGQESNLEVIGKFAEVLKDHPILLGNYQMVSKKFWVEPQKGGGDTAWCPQGYVVLGGGWSPQGGSTSGYWRVRASSPHIVGIQNGWFVSIANFHSSKKPVSVEAICAKQIILKS